ncbi:bile acid:sodium symporter family protein [Seonamhaeicola sp.]|uniref:bile acid:sodium symporter family protein n=1 Tax=Seonamhaeicola sp. TaxID=1912245 RepID=UPI0026210F9C|nr:bile acid:sodium symporter family protein [Seonamhaeicola sp.]
MRTLCKSIETYFYVLIVLVAFIGFLFPELFSWVKSYVKQILGGIMFCMGATLTFNDFKSVIKTPKLIGVGILLQYTCMPLLAYAISKVLQLPTEQLIGMVIVGCCPGGTASNLVTYLSKGNVALSVTITLCSTMLAPLLTPLILFGLLAENMPIDAFTLMKSVFWIVVFPIFDALIIRHFFEKQFQKVAFVFPSLAIILISLLVAFIVGVNKDLLMTLPLLLFLAIVLHNGLGYTLGFYISKFFRFSTKDSRTIAIEVGMQNSGLGLALANQFFSAAVALPSALFSIWHNLSGVLIAKKWSASKG